MSDDVRELTPAQRVGLEKLGDIYAPGDDEFPSFSRLGCASHAERLIEFIPPHKLRALLTLLSLCRWAPQWTLRGLIQLTELMKY